MNFELHEHFHLIQFYKKKFRIQRIHERTGKMYIENDKDDTIHLCILYIYYQ
jgi:hypothetical protein